MHGGAYASRRWVCLSCYHDVLFSGSPACRAMEFLDSYRDREASLRFAEAIKQTVTQPWTVMEVCGGQTHSIVRYGIHTLLPREITLLHGPGCPVCVTPIEMIDKGIALARLPGVILCTFGDMLRVPGSREDLFRAKSDGADVRIVYSPLDSLKIARANPDREVVFFAIGFETTAPANAMAVYQADLEKLGNYTVLCAQVLVPPAMKAILDARDNRVDGFLAAGHVCTVMGYEEYVRMARTYRVPIVVTGFEPVDILQGIHMCVQQLEEGRAIVENSYSRSVKRQGNQAAQEMVQRVFQICDRSWRGMGEIAHSGLSLADHYRDFDAEDRFKVGVATEDSESGCISGLVLQGLKKPKECPHFGKSCKPEHPLGATMVSGEGACAAYYRYDSHSPIGVH